MFIKFLVSIKLIGVFDISLSFHNTFKKTLIAIAAATNYIIITTVIDYCEVTIALLLLWALLSFILIDVHNYRTIKTDYLSLSLS